jgi:HK97 family phage portal protein
MKVLGLHIPFTRRAEARSAATIPDDRYFSPFPYWFAQGGQQPVTPETAVYFTAVYGCVKIISETLASLPLVMYRRLPNGGKERATKHPLATVLRTRPNKLKTTGLEFREMLTAHTLLWGNGYAQILKNKAGETVELHPMHPSCVTPKVNASRQVVYEVRATDGRTVILPGDEVFHVRGYRDSGLEGLSPIAAAKKAIAMGLSLESFGTNFFEGGAFPASVLEFEGQGTLSAEAKTNLRDSWEKLYGGENRGRKVAVLEAGLKWKPMGVPQTDAQFLEQRRFQIEEIARIYRVPPHMLADLERSTNNNIEKQSQEFLTYCMLPWFRRWEEAITRDFLDGDDSEYFAEFLVDGLLRGDMLSRHQAYSQGRQWGYYSINDVRAKENMNPIGAEGDIYLSPMNMVPAGDEGKVLEKDAAPKKEGGDASEKEFTKKALRAFEEPLRETWRRVLRKEIGSVKTAAKKLDADGIGEWRAKFHAEQGEFAAECLTPLLRGIETLIGVGAGELQKRVLHRYEGEVSAGISAWHADPQAGYSRKETDADYWVKETLDYGTAA